MAALPFRSRVLYAASSLGGEALSQSRALWLVYFYAPPADADRERLLPALVVGVVLFVGQLVGALDDVLIGYWSDRTRSRLGRRLPFILAGTPLMAVSAVLLFTPPASGTALTAAYLFVVVELYAVFSTVSGGPYEALLPEIARSSRERVGLVGLKVYFGVAGAGIGLVGSGLLVDRFGFRAMAIVMATVALVFRYLGAAGVWRQAQRVHPPADLALRPALRATFANRSFLAFLPTFVLFQIGLGLLTGVVPYYVEVVLEVEDEGRWVAVLTALAIGAMLAAVPVFARIAGRTSKRFAYRAAMLAAAATFPLLAFAGFVPGVPPLAQVALAMLVVGAPIAGVYLFPTALTADIVDDDAGRTGLRREGTYFGAQNFVERTAGSVAPLVLTAVLLLGSTTRDPLGIRLIGPVAGLFVLAGYLVFRAYDLPDEVPAVAPSGDTPESWTGAPSSAGTSRGAEPGA